MLLEIFAVFFAITYLILAVRQNILCWYAAFLVRQFILFYIGMFLYIWSPFLIFTIY